MSENTRSQKHVISIGYWISTFCEGTGIIVIPLYLTMLSIPASKIGITFFVYELAGILTNLCAGYFIRRCGYRWAFLISLILHSLASFGYLLLDSSMDMLTALIILSSLRAFRSIAIELIRTTSSSYFKLFTQSHRQSRFTAVQWLQGGKDIIKGAGLLTGGILLERVGFQNTFLVLGVASVISLLLAVFTLNDFRERRHGVSQGFLSVKRDMKLLGFHRLSLYFARDVWIIVPLPIFLISQGMSQVEIAMGLAVSLVVFGVMQPIAGSWTKSLWSVKNFQLKSRWRYKDLIPIPTFLLLLIPGILLITGVSTEAVIIAVILFHGINGVATSPHNYLHLKFARRSRSALDISYYKTVSQMGKLGAVFASGYMYELKGIQGCLQLSAAALVAALITGTVLAKRYEPKVKETLDSNIG